MNARWNLDSRYTGWAPMPLRLVMGIGFVFHGYPKLFTGHAGTVGFFDGLGIPLPELMTWVVGCVEFFGGIMLILGAFTTIVAALCTFEMIVAILLVHLPNGFLGEGGFELPLLYLAGFVALILSGAGPLSVDRRLENRGSRRTVA